MKKIYVGLGVELWLFLHVYSCAKDHHPNVWYSLNGERLGTYDGHCGAVWCLDPKWDTTSLITGQDLITNLILLYNPGFRGEGALTDLLYSQILLKEPVLFLLS